MGEKVPIVLPVRGDLDTSSPITDRPLGGLVRAYDAHPRRWGPKEGLLSFARLWESPGTASLYDGIEFTTGASTLAQGLSFEEQFRDLGTKWTLDLWFRIPSVAYAAAKDDIGLYKFLANQEPGLTRGVIEVKIAGGNVADHERLLVSIVTTPTRSTEDAAVTITGSTRIAVGSTQADKHHVRLVRDGANAYLYLNGVLDGSASTLVATSPIFGSIIGSGLAALGQAFSSTDPTVTFKGHLYGAWLRDGAFTSAPIEAVMPCAPHARNVHHAYLGHNYALGGNDHFFDASRFGAHARISGAGYTVTASNDSTAPAPARIQGATSWNTRGNRTATTVVGGGQIIVKGVT